MKCETILRKSRDKWKQKAIQRCEELRDTRRKLKKSQQDNQKKAPPTSPVNTRVLCVLILIIGWVSFRAVNRLLTLLQQHKIMSPGWVPHFTSIINWTCRVGLSMLQNVQKIDEKWITIMDTSIEIGLKKLLVVLRVPLTALQNRKSAITLDDAECIGVALAESWNGVSVAAQLAKFFSKAGKPIAFLQDGGKDIGKGVQLLCAQNSWIIPVIPDLGHVLANALKAKFALKSTFQNLLNAVSQASNKLRQTNLAFLIPPKIRTKGRFQGISRIAKWAQNVTEAMRTKGRPVIGSLQAQFHKLVPNLGRCKYIISKFLKYCSVNNELSKLLKNDGLNQKSYKLAKDILESLPAHCRFRKTISLWLKRTIRIQCRLGIAQTPLPISSDVIESLMGRLKNILERSPNPRF